MTLSLPVRPVIEMVARRHALRKGSASSSLARGGVAQRGLRIGQGRAQRARSPRRTNCRKYASTAGIRRTASPSRGCGEPADQARDGAVRAPGSTRGRPCPVATTRSQSADFSVTSTSHETVFPFSTAQRVALRQDELGVAQVGPVSVDHRLRRRSASPSSSSAVPRKSTSRSSGDARALQEQHRHELADRGALHVGRAAAPDVAVADLARRTAARSSAPRPRARRPGG